MNYYCKKDFQELVEKLFGPKVRTQQQEKGKHENPC